MAGPQLEVLRFCEHNNNDDEDDKNRKCVSHLALLLHFLIFAGKSVFLIVRFGFSSVIYLHISPMYTHK